MCVEVVITVSGVEVDDHCRILCLTQKNPFMCALNTIFTHTHTHTHTHARTHAHDSDRCKGFGSSQCLTEWQAITSES
jgi:hypothetical protein